MANYEEGHEDIEKENLKKELGETKKKFDELKADHNHLVKEHNWMLDNQKMNRKGGDTIIWLGWYVIYFTLLDTARRIVISWYSTGTIDDQYGYLLLGFFWLLLLTYGVCKAIMDIVQIYDEELFATGVKINTFIRETQQARKEYFERKKKEEEEKEKEKNKKKESEPTKTE